jgi:hypothetical protein
MRHRVPFHLSATGPMGMFELSKDSPTPMQNVRAVQDTPKRAVPGAPAGLGTGWMLHFLPSQCSASVPVGFSELSVRAPTAVQATDDVQDTLARKPPPARLGVCWIRHFAPSHRSAKGRFAASPVAVQADGDVQDTLANWLGAAPLGLGVGWMRHRLPSHRSARGWNAPARVMLAPTAVHADGAVQETPDRELTATPRGLGVGWMRHLLPFHRWARVTPTPEALT